MATNKKTAKTVSKKPVVKKAVLKKAAKKAAPVKKVTKSTVKAKAAPKKTAVKPTKPTKKSIPSKKQAKPIKKIAPAKKAAVKKVATPIKKSTPVKQKPVVKASKPAQKKPEPKKIENKPAIIKTLPKAKYIKSPSPKHVVLPKITATKARKYEPEFTKSVLDQAPYENNGPTMRYSDSELNEFRELIQRKLETAKKELGYLQGLITRKDEMGGDDTDNRYMTMEDGSLSMEREQLSQMASRQITFIDHLEKAMMRIENKTYGICRVTGKLIDKARLRAVPHATLSIEAKMGIAK